jgi:hypothetical protein
MKNTVSILIRKPEERRDLEEGRVVLTMRYEGMK